MIDLAAPPLSCLDRLAPLHIGVIGDFCLDAYLTLDEGEPELSVETGKPTNAVRRMQFVLGGAGNVVANLAALGVGGIHVFGIVGEDPFAAEMQRLLHALRVDTTALLAQSADWSTCVYMKRIMGTTELNRIDFGRFNTPSEQSEAALLAHLENVVPTLDALIINQQFKHGFYSPRVIAALNALAARHPRCAFIVDARDVCAEFKHMILKSNAHEAARLCGIASVPDQSFSAEAVCEMAAALEARSAHPVFITRGHRGLVVQAAGKTHCVPGVQIMGNVDPVGAGDTFVSALAAALSAGTTPVEAGMLANLASAVTIQKLFQTGTASPEEIRALAADVDYQYQPELAEDPRKAQYLADSQIEFISEPIPLGTLQHAVFDHDGTISVLREGWESVMEAVMLEQILGPALATIDEQQYQSVVQHVRRFIDQTTGQQTILQMEALVDLIREYGFVPESDIRCAPAYKQIYLAALMQQIHRRFSRLNSGEMQPGDFVIKGAVEFLQALRARGVTLYLASGTDEADVQAEARMLGYADLFDGGIFGAVDSVSKNAKKMVIERIIREHSLTGPQLACFGDGPVEMREARKHGGLAIGLASDEIRRYGLNPEKRTRLLKAGAQFILPDFSQGPRLLDHLFSTAPAPVGAAASTFRP
jgi:rfaE bifunctional protein kinase chain/domain